jgi:hypothetical protein
MKYSFAPQILAKLEYMKWKNHFFILNWGTCEENHLHHYSLNMLPIRS